MFFNVKSPDVQAERYAQRAAEDAQRLAQDAECARFLRSVAEEADRAANGPAGRRASFMATPVRQAQAAYERGDRLFQFSLDLATTTDPVEILNAVGDQGWDLVSGSFVSGEQEPVAYYLFRHCAENRRAVD